MEIKGVKASLGRAKGIVKIVLNKDDLKKVNDGDILLSVMTTPDFVHAMKKASAIVTDEGSILCHAAIISRELKIPCIVATKIATQVLETGDLVEVDATNKSVISIIKRRQEV